MPAKATDKKKVVAADLQRALEDVPAAQVEAVRKLLRIRKPRKK